ncbi:MAG: hypothetical protein KAH84_09795 [Thiomargarita sp.]|nr:hypothetical protein [Bacteroidales bacterium]MCK5720224.1 hypothetical protein [Thiomargarita sp.]
MPLEAFGEEQIYNFERVGSFGRFYSGESFPIEYIMTSFMASELFELTFARDIHPEQLDFELLMQRDIDEERVRIEIEPYLNPSSKDLTLAEIRSRSVFFPPLLAAIVPTKGKSMEPYYSNEKSYIAHNELNNKELVIREWAGLFKLTYFLSASPQAYCIQVPIKNKTTAIGVQCQPVQLELKLAKGNQYGTKLVIIDGQHRLFTLRQVYEKSPHLLEYLGVPVCILFAPHATEQKNQEYAPYKIPTVPEVFRHLFVDVNNTAKQVGGHFNILLSDDSIGNITCRKFCDYVLRQHSGEGLAVIEWNTKGKSDSNKITRIHSITTIGILNKALAESVGSRKRIIEYLLQLEDIKEQLYPKIKDENIDYPSVAWNKFALSQKNILEQQIETYLIPCLDLIFFGTLEFATNFEIFCDEINELKNLANSEQEDALEAKQVLNQVINYMPIGDGKSFESTRIVYRNFETSVRNKKERYTASIIQYALFQRAIFEVWAQFLDIARQFIPDPRQANKGFIKLLDSAFIKQGQFFAFEQIYMQNTVFAGNQIITRQETKKYLTQLLMIHLSNKTTVQRICKEIKISDKKFATKLEMRGKTALDEFPKYYQIARKRIFKSNYRTYLSIDEQERAELIAAEEEQKRHSQEVKEGKRAKIEISKYFEQLVEKHIKADVDLAMETLNNMLVKAKVVRRPRKKVKK